MEFFGLFFIPMVVLWSTMFWWVVGGFCVLGFLLRLFFGPQEFWSWPLATLLILFGIFMATLTSVSVLPWVIENWRLALLYLGGYLVAGVVYAFIKWLFVLYDKRDEFRDKKPAYINQWKDYVEAVEKDRNRFSYTNEELAQMKGSFEGFMNLRFPDTIPKAINHKADFAWWITGWPLSGLYTIFDSPLRRFVRFIYNTFSKTWDRMARWVWADEFKV